MRIKNLLVLPFIALLPVAACSGSHSKERTHINTIEYKNDKQGTWKYLIEGNSIKGWHQYLGDTVTGWQVQDGVLFTKGKNSDIVTDDVFSNFELSLEWKIEKGGNSGIFYHVVESPEYKRMHQTGPEFQIIDNENYPAELTEQQKTGALSDVLAPTDAALKPIGEWNHTRIIVDQGVVEHWLNGKKILEYQLGSEKLNQHIAASKFSEYPYAKIQSGRIGLQDHGGAAYFRNIKIRTIKTTN